MKFISLLLGLSLLSTQVLTLPPGIAQEAVEAPSFYKLNQLQNFDPPLQSVQGRPIEIYLFGSRAHGPERESKSEYIFIFGGFHGDEIPGPFLVRQLMLRLAEQPERFASKKIYCVPEVNPDGVLKRTRVNARGVDLNRNFATRNYQAGKNLKTRYYAGPSALSEPESQIVEALIRPYLEDPEAKERIKILSIHSPLKVNNYDGQGQKLAQAMQTHNGYAAEADIGYPTPGSFGTYYGSEQGVAVVTLETGPESPELAWQYQEQALLAFISTPLKD